MATTAEIFNFSRPMDATIFDFYQKKTVWIISPTIVETSFISKQDSLAYMVSIRMQFSMEVP